MPCIVDAESSWMAVSTNTEAKYLPEGVMLMVTVFTIPLNLRCSTAGIPLALGDGRVPLEVHATMLRALKTLTILSAFEAWKSNRMSVTKKVFCKRYQGFSTHFAKLANLPHLAMMFRFQFPLHAIGQFNIAE